MFLKRLLGFKNGNNSWMLGGRGEIRGEECLMYLIFLNFGNFKMIFKNEFHILNSECISKIICSNKR